MARPPLTVKQDLFIAEILRTGDSAAAVAAAGYKVPPKSDPYEVAAKLRQRPAVKQAIAERQAEIREAVNITAAQVTLRAWEIACSDAPDRVPALKLVAQRFPEFSAKYHVEHSGSVDLRAIDSRRESLRAMLLAAGVDPELVDAADRGEVIDAPAVRLIEGPETVLTPKTGLSKPDGDSDCRDSVVVESGEGHNELTE